MTSDLSMSFEVDMWNVPLLIYSTLIVISIGSIPYAEANCFCMDVIVTTETLCVTGLVLSILKTYSQK